MESDEIINKFGTILEECYTSFPKVEYIKSKEIFSGCTEYEVSYKLSNNKVLTVIFKKNLIDKSVFSHIKSYDGIEFPIKFSISRLNQRSICLSNGDIINVSSILAMLGMNTFIDIEKEHKETKDFLAKLDAVL